MRLNRRKRHGSKDSYNVHDAIFNLVAPDPNIHQFAHISCLYMTLLTVRSRIG